MAVKPIKEKRRVNNPPTIIHESSANSAQNAVIKITSQEKNEKLNSSHRRTHSGSDGADQERGSNH